MSEPAFTAVSPAMLRIEAGQRTGATNAIDLLAEAFEFVSLCNCVTTPRIGVIDDGDGRRMEFLRGELEPKQEAAFAKACEYIGQRFADATRELMANHG
jgi:hypothetical protein